MPSKISNLSFSTQPFENAFSVTPLVDGAPVSEMASAFERDRRFEPAGGYGGLIPQWFKYGPLDKYFLGQFEEGSYFAKMGRIYLLGCRDCGEAGCWPLTARVDVREGTVSWDTFEQPFRRERDYSGFGPFAFDASQYGEALATLLRDFSGRIRSDEV
jgi:hypothetical protein